MIRYRRGLGALRRLVAALVHNWPQKLGATLLAALVWLFVTVDDTSVTQRSLLVPISVEGVAEDTVVTGLPTAVEVTVTGASSRIDRLRPESFEAVLDLAGQTGAFEQPIRVLLPPAVDLIRFSPSDVIGTIEPVTTKEVAVETVLLGSPGPDTRVEVTPDPPSVQVRGRSSTLAQVARVVAPTGPAPGQRTVTPFAADTAGHPVAGVATVPAELTVTVTTEPLLVQRSVTVALAPPSLPTYSVTARLDQPTVSVVGPPSQLDGLETVPGTVELATENPAPGSYTLPVTLELPTGVSALQPLTATVRLVRPSLTR